MKIGFDHEKYIAEQSQYILERVNNYDKLYLEFGGKLISDLHAKRVLPGFDENAKIKLLQTLKDKAEIIICVYAGDIERNKIRGDFGITYDMDVLRLIDDLKGYGLEVNSVVITRYDHQPATTVFIKKLERQNIKVYTHKAIKGYPTDVDAIVSDEGYGINPFIETSKPIVVVTAPGPGSGKLATCLNQLYHEHRLGKSAGYSKFETFPVWNLPLKHPVNIAYEAATVDLKDANMMDYFHYDAYKVPAVNYNRDLEMFPVIRRIIERITGTESVYKSPTDMGVNRIGFGIIDDEVVREAALQEIIRRDFKTECEFKKGQVDYDAVQRMKLIMEDVGLHQEDRIPVVPAREFAAAKTEQNPDHTKEVYAATALALNDGTIITGRTSRIMVSGAAALINAIKHLAGIADEIPLIAPSVLNTIFNLKRNNLHSKHCVLDVEEVLIALSISAVTNPMAQYAIDKLQELNGVQGHTTVMLPHGDEQTFRKLGIDITCDPQYPSENLSYT